MDNKCNDVVSAVKRFIMKAQSQGKTAKEKDSRLKRAEQNMNSNGDDHVNVADGVE